jgi:hypothetical protein
VTGDDELARAPPNRPRDQAELADTMNRIGVLWQQGLGPRAIALQLEVSAGVVSGLLARARPRPPTPPRPPMQRKKMTAKPPPVAATPTRPKPFGKLGPGECSWPLNAPEKGGVFLCCSAPVAKPRAVYCVEHTRLSVSVSSPSLRAPAAPGT